MPKSLPRILCYLWIAALALSFYIWVRTSYRQSLATEEYAYACDAFGYLRMAHEIRNAFSRATWPEFKLESKQTRLLIDYLKSQNYPVSRWNEVVAPHAHHYFPRTNYVGVQYPPGTGLVLAAFPQGEAVYGMNRAAVFAFVLVGVVAFVIAVWKRAWASIGLVVLSLSLGLIVLARVGALSFSINAGLVPILLTCFFTLFALWFQNDGRNGWAWLFALLAGLAIGFATLIRLPSFLLAPGFLILLWPGLRKFRIKSLPIAFAIGATVAGVIPVLINQREVAGAWYASTYASVDSALPSTEGLRFNLWFFLGAGQAAVDNLSLLAGALGFVGFLLLYARRGSEPTNRFGLSWKRLTLAVAAMWVIPILYFLTHVITGPHYMIPSVFATIALAGFGALAIESTTTTAKQFDTRKILSWAALLLVLCPGVLTLKRAWFARSAGEPAPVKAATHAPIVLPAELADDKAWVWADLLTGSLWYYANKAAFKVDIADEQTRAMLFKFVFDRGERQYVIEDSIYMKKYMAQIERMGGKLEPRGKVGGEAYYLVVWPSEGPR